MGAGGFGVLGWRLGRYVSEISTGQERLWPWGLVLALTGVPLGAFVAPYITLKPLHKGVDFVNGIPGSTLLAGIIGLLVGLIVASLLSIPLYTLDGWLGLVLPLLVIFTLGVTGMWLGMQRARDMQAVFPALEKAKPTNVAANPTRNGAILVDTSAIIDGRIADLSVTGFVEGILVVPRFVLDELRHIADSSDPLRRNRGRRGLEVLGRLRQSEKVSLEVLDVGVSQGNEVDSELVYLARSMKIPILTTDYNLNRVAELQGVQVLNVNDLANALKSIVLPGEELRLEIVQEGKEPGQGVAYLDDGTMVVVEGGRSYINSSHDVVVTRVLQTAAGRIIFAQSRNG
ncbi:MAG: twitching motility protein PilT [SAR202 cluster bacterium Casp-Chloro-G3]|nr:MAG: twitching motility protein PilT [SAR202 cluster bacterium Casp-Chloro-G3]